MRMALVHKAVDLTRSRYLVRAGGPSTHPLHPHHVVYAEGSGRGV